MSSSAVMSVSVVGLHGLLENKQRLHHEAGAARGLRSLFSGPWKLLDFDGFCCFRVLLVGKWLG